MFIRENGSLMLPVRFFPLLFGFLLRYGSITVERSLELSKDMD